MPIQVVCLHCGETFSCYPSQRRQFCSVACRTEHRREAGAWEQRVCKTCGKTFDIAGARLAEGGGTYCSDSCRVADKAIPSRACPTCGENFISRHRSDYCSKQCAGVARRTREERRCRTCGITFWEEPSRVSTGRGIYCSKACAFPGPLERECEKCGAVFTASRSEVAKGWGRFCSNECRRTRVQRVCATCGEGIEVTLSKLAGDAGKYCSVECRGLARRNRIQRRCAICGSAFERPASTVERSAAMYCSRDCLTVARRENPAEVERVRKMQRDHLASRAPTRPERVLYSLLDELLGEGAWASQYHVFDKWTVDAAVPSHRLIIQADGDYWHGWDPETHHHPLVARNMRNDRRQDAYISKTDWTSLRLWEHDLLDRPEWCAERIQAALANFSRPSEATQATGPEQRVDAPVPNPRASAVTAADGPG